MMRALRGLAALAALAALVSNALAAWQEGLLAQNLSYFTNLSNLGLVLLVLAGSVSTRRPPCWDALRGGVTLALVMTGLIYALVIAPPEELLRWDIGWQGIVLHRVVPVVALLDWIISPVVRRGRLRQAAAWLLWPALYLALTWWRGTETGWYPYAFLDPTLAPREEFAVTMGGVVAAFAVVALVLHLVGGRRVSSRGGASSSRGGASSRAAAQRPAS